MSGCWLWTAYVDAAGYGRVGWEGASRMAHRVVYVLLVGPIPDGEELDHLCRNHPCVSPWHLEPVTRPTNILRGRSPGAQRERHAAITQCPQGHPYDEANTRYRLTPEGRWTRRDCMACDRERATARYHASHPSAARHGPYKRRG